MHRQTTFLTQPPLTKIALSSLLHYLASQKSCQNKLFPPLNHLSPTFLVLSHFPTSEASHILWFQGTLYMLLLQQLTGALVRVCLPTQLELLKSSVTPKNFGIANIYKSAWHIKA